VHELFEDPLEVGEGIRSMAGRGLGSCSDLANDFPIDCDLAGLDPLEIWVFVEIDKEQAKVGVGIEGVAPFAVRGDRPEVVAFYWDAFV
jgi:hypothetical protein